GALSRDMVGGSGDLEAPSRPRRSDLPRFSPVYLTMPIPVRNTALSKKLLNRNSDPRSSHLRTWARELARFCSKSLFFGTRWQAADGHDHTAPAEPQNHPRLYILSFGSN